MHSAIGRRNQLKIDWPIHVFRAVLLPGFVSLVFVLSARDANAFAENPVILSSTEVPNNARQMAINSQTQSVYVASLGGFPGGSLTVLDGASYQEITTLSMGSGPYDVDVDEVRNLVFATDGANRVHVIDGEANEIIDSITIGSDVFGVAVNETTNLVYVSNPMDNTVSVYSPEIEDLVATISVGERPSAIAVDEENNLVYVTTWMDDAVSVIDGESLEVIEAISVGPAPQDVAWHGSTNRVFVANGTVSVIDGNTLQVIDELSTSGGQRVSVDQVSNTLYVSSPFSSPGKLYAFDPVTLQPLWDMDSSQPFGILADPTSDRLFVTGNDPDRFDVIAEECLSDPGPGEPDSDSDGVIDGCDNCIYVPNAQQENFDGDFNGDACDLDIDGDDIRNADDPDADGDLIPNATEVSCGGDPLNSGSGPERTSGQFAGVDDDGDTLVDEALPAGAEDFDCDRDGFTGAVEAHVYSYLPQTDGDQKVCGLYDTSFPDPNQNATPSRGWPADFRRGGIPDSTEKITITDLTSFLAPIRYLGTNVGTNPGDVRWDLNPGPGVIGVDVNITDLTAMIAGSSGSPPMLGGVRALGGPECPWPE